MEIPGPAEASLGLAWVSLGPAWASQGLVRGSNGLAWASYGLAEASQGLARAFLGLDWASLGLAEAFQGLAEASQGLAEASHGLDWASLGLGGDVQMDGQTDGRTDGNSPLCSTGHHPFRVRCPKGGREREGEWERERGEAKRTELDRGRDRRYCAGVAPPDTTDKRRTGAQKGSLGPSLERGNTW